MRILWLTLGLLGGLMFQAAGDPARLPIDRSRQRDLQAWKPQIQAYSKRHYGEDTWQLRPTCIVLHYTAGTSFPWNLVNTGSFLGERPGLASHYVIDGARVWQILPPDVRSRGAFGINHRAINIEMVAADAADLARRPRTLESCARLCGDLMERFSIPLEKIYSHQDVGAMDASLVPEVLDRTDPSPYGKVDPGEQNMQTVLDLLTGSSSR
ncbi:MAG: peptidoglycan recognition family protein [Candidatus Eremiobacterota bacterium]